MLTFPLIYPPRRRGRVKTPAVAPAPPAALVVVGVFGVGFAGDNLEMNVRFDATEEFPMNVPAAADPAKWTARYQGQAYVGNTIALGDYDFLYLQLTPAGAEAGADVLNYANAPSDVSDSVGRFLAAFSGFPI